MRGYVNPVDTRDIPFKIPRLGVNVELTQYTPDDLRKNLDLMQQANITWVRQFVRWNEIEPTKGVFDWHKWDEIISVLGEYPDLELVAVLVNAPAWATNSSLNNAPPNSPSDFAVFAAEFANRYQEQIDYYQIWDEPNIETGWGMQPPRAAEYAVLLEACYSAIHQHDPDSYVMAAALAPTVETGPDNVSDVIYLENLYRLGAASYADGFAAKPYGFSYSPDDRTVDSNVLNFSRIILLREIMVKYGDGKKHLWASNWGWNYLPPSWDGLPSIWGQVNEQEQIAFTQSALRRAEREWAWLGGMILHHWQPDAPPDDPIWGFTLIAQDGTPTAIYNALSNMSLQTSVASNGLYAAKNPYAQYSGTWTFSVLGADIGWVQDSRVKFEFAGEEIALLVREDDYVAYFYVTIDGTIPNKLPLDTNGNAYLLLKSDDLTPQVSLIPLANNLKNTAYHELHLIADELIPNEINHRWALIGFAVSDGDLSSPYDRQITISSITTFITFLALLVAIQQVNWASIRVIKIFWNSITIIWQLSFGMLVSIALTVSMFLTWHDGVPAVFRRDSIQLLVALMTAGLAYLNPGLVITIFCCLVLFWVIFNRIQIGLLLVIFWSPFFMYPVELYRFAFPIAEILLWLTFGAWIIQQLINYRRVTIRLNRFDWLIISLVIIGAITITWAEWRDAAITEFRTLFIQPALFYMMLRTTTLDKQFTKQLIGVVIFSGVLVAGIGIIGWIRNDITVITAEEGVRRLSSVYGSPNNVGLYLGRCIPFALAIACLTKKYRFVAAASLLIMAVAVLLSQSAGALFVGIPASVAAILIAIYGRRAFIPLIALLFVGSVGILIAIQTPRFERLVNLTEGTNFYRIRVWESAINAIEDHPIQGLGLDQFLYQFRGQYILPDAWEEPNLSHPHNIILDFWTRLGFAGVVWLFAFFVIFWQRVWQYKSSIIGVAIIGSMVNMLAHGLIDNSIYVLDLMVIFMLLLGLVANPSAEMRHAN
ncbi:MAG: O-antigen ligase family protein [Phototrophicales bacterium]